MNKNDFKELYEQMLKEESVLVSTKGEEYTLQNEDQLYNFKVVAFLTGLTPEQVASVYMAKHFLSIMNYTREGKTISEEPIAERISDLRNYLALFRGITEDNKEDKC